MSPTQAPERPLKLAFADPEEAAPGMRVLELLLAPEGFPRPPFNISRDTIEPGCTTPEDCHLVREVWLIVEGEGELLYDGRAVRVRAGEAVYFEPFKTHQLKNDSEQPITFYSIWWGA